MDVDQIEVVVQPQSIIHSMVEYVDGAVIAQLGTPDMKLPIQYALYYRSADICRETGWISEACTADLEEPDWRPSMGCGWHTRQERQAEASDGVQCCNERQ